MAETAEDAKAGWEMEGGRDDQEETRAAMLGGLGGSGGRRGSRGLLPGADASLLRDRGESNEDSDSSAVDSDEEVRRMDRACVAHAIAAHEHAHMYCIRQSRDDGVAACLVTILGW